MWCFVWASSVANTSFNFAKGWNFRLSCLSSLCLFGGRFRVADNLLITLPSDFKLNNCLLALYTILVVLILPQYINFLQTFNYFFHFPQIHFNPLLTKKLTTAPIEAIMIVLIISPASNIATTLNIVPDTVPIIVVLSFVYPPFGQQVFFLNYCPIYYS